MTFGSSHVYKGRNVINSTYSSKELLSGLSISQIRQRFDSSLAFTRHKDHRTHAQVLSDKCDSTQTVGHNIGLGPYKATVVDFIAPKQVKGYTKFNTNKARASTVSNIKTPSCKLVGFITTRLYLWTEVIPLRIRLTNVERKVTSTWVSVNF